MKIVMGFRFGFCNDLLSWHPSKAIRRDHFGFGCVIVRDRTEFEDRKQNNKNVSQFKTKHRLIRTLVLIFILRSRFFMYKPAKDQF